LDARNKKILYERIFPPYSSLSNHQLLSLRSTLNVIPNLGSNSRVCKGGIVDALDGIVPIAKPNYVPLPTELAIVMNYQNMQDRIYEHNAESLLED
jgi:hypothetical protein